MAAQLIDGKKISQQRIEAVAQAVKARQEKGLHTPCLAVVLVGDDPASAVYVRNKKLACQKAASNRALTSCRLKPRKTIC